MFLQNNKMVNWQALTQFIEISVYLQVLTLVVNCMKFQYYNGRYLISIIGIIGSKYVIDFTVV